MAKPSSILHAEDLLGFALAPVETREQITSYRNDRTYLLDDKNEVIGLNLYNSNVSDISFLEQFPAVEILELYYNQITNIDVLRHCTKLTKLNLIQNKVVNLDPLAA